MENTCIPPIYSWLLAEEAFSSPVYVHTFYCILWWYIRVRTQSILHVACQDLTAHVWWFYLHLINLRYWHQSISHIFWISGVSIMKIHQNKIIGSSRRLKKIWQLLLYDAATCIVPLQVYNTRYLAFLSGDPEVWLPHPESLTGHL